MHFFSSQVLILILSYLFPFVFAKLKAVGKKVLLNFSSKSLSLKTLIRHFRSQCQCFIFMLVPSLKWLFVCYLVGIVCRERHDLEAFGKILLEGQIGVQRVENGNVVVHVLDQNGNLEEKGKNHRIG